MITSVYDSCHTTKLVLPCMILYCFWLQANWYGSVPNISGIMFISLISCGREKVSEVDSWLAVARQSGYVVVQFCNGQTPGGVKGQLVGLFLWQVVHEQLGFIYLHNINTLTWHHWQGARFYCDVSTTLWEVFVLHNTTKIYLSINQAVFFTWEHRMYLLL